MDLIGGGPVESRHKVGEGYECSKVNHVSTISALQRDISLHLSVTSDPLCLRRFVFVYHEVKDS